MIDRRTFLKSTAASAITPAFGQTRDRKPNFVVILADDMGYSDAGCYGGDIDTPNLDKLAAGGLRFTQAYSTARCGPSRDCLLTGYYAQQTAADIMTPGNTPEWTCFLPEYLKPQGYRCYHSGKWHIKFKALGGTGFDNSYMLLDENRYFAPRVQHLNEQPLPPVKASDNFYVTKAIGEHGVQFLKQHAAEHANDPFSCTWRLLRRISRCMHCRKTSITTRTGFPKAGSRRERGVFSGCAAWGWSIASYLLWRLGNGRRGALRTRSCSTKIGPGEVTRAVAWSTLTPEQKKLQRTKMSIHAAMITRMDREIGRVVEQLRRMNQLDNTVILFLSDNGASAEQIIRGDGHDKSAAPGSGASYLCLGPGWASASNTPFRLHKSYVHEGGIASPLIVHWPAGIREKGALRHDPCHFIDVAADAARSRRRQSSDSNPERRSSAAGPEPCSGVCKKRHC